MIDFTPTNYSIGYYISIVDDTASTIDSMSKTQVIELATETLNNLDILNNIVDCSRSQVRQCRDFASKYDFEGSSTANMMLQFAHALLTKAMTMD
jgi:hypothetical protein